MLKNRIIAAVISGVVAVSTCMGVVMPSAPAAKAAEVIGDENSAGLNKLDKLSVSSPDGKIRIQIWDDEYGTYYYSAYLNDNVVIQCSPIGIVLTDNDLSDGLLLDESSVKTETGKDDYDIIQGPVNHVNKEYNQLNFTLTKGSSEVTVNFRADNQGIAYRYNVDADTAASDEYVSVKRENSTFTLPDMTTYWTTSYSATYEPGQYSECSSDQMKSRSEGTVMGAPILAKTENDNWVLLAEAGVFSTEDAYTASAFVSESGSTRIRSYFGQNLWDEDGGEQFHKIRHDRDHEFLEKIIAGTGRKKSQSVPATDMVTFTDKFSTAWRVAIIGESLNDVTSSTLISDLNPPAEGDFSWVVPGTSVWSWWSTGDNISYESMKDYIDFCSTAGITYCLVDFGWENWQDYESKVLELIDYANERNVGLLLWYGVHKWDNEHQFDLDNDEDIEEQFSWCEDVGVKGVKVDYIESDSQFAMKNMYKILESAARHHLVVNFHGATDPNGECRTFPNLLSMEAVQGMEYFKWSNASPVDTLVTLPFTRNVLGSMEYTPSLFALPHDASMGSQYSPATAGFMLSMCIEYESAVETFAQSGYVYPGYRAFPLIADVPSTWDESILIGGYPKSHCIRARRNGENWYIGAMTVKASNYSVPLDFLNDGEEYYAYIYRDNEDGTDIECDIEKVTSKDVLNLDLMDNGGCAVKLSVNDPEKWTEYDNYTYYEAEDAELTGSATVNKNKTYTSGLATVSGIGNSAGNIANMIRYNNISVPEDGTYNIRLYVSAGNKKNLTIRVNEDEEYTFSDVVGVAGTDAVGTYANPVEINLKAGDNIIELYSESSNAPEVDRIAVSKALITNSEVTLGTDEYTYDGNRCEPSVTVVRDGKTLVENVEYSVFYSNNIKAGTAKVYITGINGYGGQIVKEFTINEPPKPPVEDMPSEGNKNTDTVVGGGGGQQQAASVPGAVQTATKAPGKVKISSAKSKKKGQIVVKYKKVNGADGYQVAYGMSKKVKKAKIINAKKKTKVTVKKLKSGKRYYVRVRAYKKQDGRKITGKWSKAAVVKKVK